MVNIKSEDIIYTERKGTGSVKWDLLKETFGQDSLLPVWVADMDFKSPECVREAIRESAEKDVYGYFVPPEKYFTNFIKWQEKRKGGGLRAR